MLNTRPPCVKIVVEAILQEAEESFHRQQRFQAKGIGLEQLQQTVAKLFEIPVEELMGPGRERLRVRARSLLSYWAVGELGMTMTFMAKETGLSVAAISKAVRRGKELANQEDYVLEKVLKI